MVEAKSDVTAKISARAMAQKAYKKEKKKRAKAKRAERKKRERELESTIDADADNTSNDTKEQEPPKQWYRVFGLKKATNRPVNDEQINELLSRRSEEKANKNYSVSDEITKTLIDMEIIYDEEKRQWHTRALMTELQKEAKKNKVKKRTGVGSKSSENDSATNEPSKKKLKSSN